jgi:hypothetical protein
MHPHVAMCTVKYICDMNARNVVFQCTHSAWKSFITETYVSLRNDRFEIRMAVKILMVAFRGVMLCGLILVNQQMKADWGCRSCCFFTWKLSDEPIEKIGWWLWWLHVYSVIYTQGSCAHIITGGISYCYLRGRITEMLCILYASLSAVVFLSYYHSCTVANEHNLLSFPFIPLVNSRWARCRWVQYQQLRGGYSPY